MNGEQYLEACGWQRVTGGWEHPNQPGHVRTTANALIEQGDMPRPVRSIARVFGHRPDPSEWERDHG
jgi:hypothetical protein